MIGFIIGAIVGVFGYKWYLNGGKEKVEKLLNKYKRN